MNDETYYYKGNPEYIETKNRGVQLLVQPTTFKGLKKIAVEKEISLNELVNCIFKEYVEKYDKEYFNLEREFKKLKTVEFEAEKFNYSLVWDNRKSCIDYSWAQYGQHLTDIFFTRESIQEFLENISDKKITKEQFFRDYKKVFVQSEEDNNE